MRQTWRWFGPADEISLEEVRQTGAQGIVSALHHIPTGEVWTAEDIMERKTMIEAVHPLTWDVVESVPVSEAIKTKTGDYKHHYETYRQSLRNLAACGIKVICYNFMPILDWTRTDLHRNLPNGAQAMFFDVYDFAMFDLHLLARDGADADYSDSVRAEAAKRFEAATEGERQGLINNIVAGLPGANERWTLDDVRAQLATYDGISPEQLRGNLIDFLAEVVPTAEELGLRLCCHPDDPPFSLLGLPRIMSNLADYKAVLEAVDSHANGATMCTGSLGIDPDFDPEEFVETLGDRIHFVHLRNTARDGAPEGPRHSFHESEHLGGDTDMVATVRALMNEQSRRKSAGRDDWQIPMRPDHGQSQLADLERRVMPGYPLIGRMRGLAELRGIMAALS